MSAVMCGLPILAPLALAFAIPERTLSRIIRCSNSAKTPLIWIKALVIGSICPLEQSTQILPTMERRKHFSFTVSMISQSCRRARIQEKFFPLPQISALWSVAE